MKQSWKHDKHSIGGLLGLALLLFMLPVQWICAVFVAGLLHEMGHYISVYLLGGDVHSIKFGAVGTVMEASGLTQRAEVISILAGPLAGLLPILTIRTFPAVAICGLVQTIYNLIPIYPLDGGKVLLKIILLCGGTERCFHIIEYSVLSLLLLISIYIRIRFNISLFLFLIILLCRKTPCKLHGD